VAGAAAAWGGSFDGKPDAWGSRYCRKQRRLSAR